MAYLAFYDSKTRSNRTLMHDDLSACPSFNLTNNGSLSMRLEFEVTPANRAFLKSLKENSHFVVFSAEQGSGDTQVCGIVEDPAVNGGWATVDVVGFKELLDKIVLFSSEKIGLVNAQTTVRQDDPSFTKNFYADNSEGTLYEVLRNLESALQVKGGSRFWNYGNMESYIEQITGTEWKHVYRLDSLELPFTGDVVSDVTQDESMAILKVAPNEDGGTFEFDLNFSNANPAKAIDESTDWLWDLSIEKSDQVRRRFSMATGTDLNGQNLVSIIDFDDDVLTTMSVVEAPAEATKSLAYLNSIEKNKLARKIGQVSFSSDEGSLAPLNSRVTIDSPSNPDEPIVCVIDQIAFANNEYTFTGSIVNSPALIKGHNTANRVSRNMLDPLVQARRLSRRNAFGAKTGWRSVE